MFFTSKDDLLELRKKKHEEWHQKSTYFGANKTTIDKVVWRYEKVE